MCLQKEPIFRNIYVVNKRIGVLFLNCLIYDIEGWMELCKIIQCTLIRRGRSKKQKALWQMAQQTDFGDEIFEKKNCKFKNVFFFLIFQAFFSAIKDVQSKTKNENELITVKSNCCSSWNKSQSCICKKKRNILPT